jgi:hypothetical protein
MSWKTHPLLKTLRSKFWKLLFSFPSFNPLFFPPFFFWFFWLLIFSFLFFLNSFAIHFFFTIQNLKTQNLCFADSESENTKSFLFTIQKSENKEYNLFIIKTSENCLMFTILHPFGTRESIRRKIDHGGHIVLWYWQNATNLAMAIVFVVYMSSARVLVWVRGRVEQKRSLTFCVFGQIRSKCSSSSTFPKS